MLDAELCRALIESFLLNKRDIARTLGPDVTRRDEAVMEGDGFSGNGNVIFDGCYFEYEIMPIRETC